MGNQLLSVGDKFRIECTDGYIFIYAPEHPSSKSKGYIREHKLIVEKALGRSLEKDECVHHFDGDKKNNAHNNLVICQGRGYHHTLHRRTRAKNECGNPNWRKCGYCKRYDNPVFMVTSNNGKNYHHKKCRSEYKKQYDKKRRA